MFKKSIKPKGNVKCKSSERKQIVENFVKVFNISATEIESLFNIKEIYKVKFPHNMVYMGENEPLFVENEKKLIPSVYVLNHFPHILPTFTCPDLVVPIIQNGADLMLPGLVFPGQPDDAYGPHLYGKLEKGALCAINTIKNSTPFAVGHTAKSSFDMFMSGRRGVAVTVFHVIGDHLWQLGSQTPLIVRPHHIPQIPIVSNDNEPSGESVDATNEEIVLKEVSDLMNESLVISKEDETESTTIVTEDMNDQLSGELINQSDDATNSSEQCENADHEETVDENTATECVDYNELLLQMFLQAIKYSVKDKSLPIPVNVFHAKHVLAYCPPEQDLNMKKTKYKKVGVFLTQMANDGLIQLSYDAKHELQDVVSINREHELFRQARNLLEKREMTSNQATKDTFSISPEASYLGPPEIQLVYLIRAQHLPLLQGRLKVGDAISGTALREAVTSYVRTQGLIPENGKGSVVLNETLRKILPDQKLAQQETVSWKVLMDGLNNSFPSGYQIVYPNGDIVLRRGDGKKGKPSGPPAIALESQSAGSGNKTVTRIYHLEDFRIQASHFATLVQKGRACSCVATEDKQTRPCLQCQGDHKDYCSWLLERIYGLKRDNIIGYTEMKKDKSKKTH